MKKALIALTALMMVGFFATSSFAAGQVQMTLTSPTIYKSGCEKIGSTTYSFDGGSTITAGDWWYMDLPENVSLCKSYNYIVAGIGSQANPMIEIDSDLQDPYENVIFSGGTITSITAGGDGPLSAGGVNEQFTVSGQMAFLVTSTSNPRRIAIYALTDAATPGTVEVETDSTLELKLFDGKSWSKIDTQVAEESRILLDLDGDGIYGEQDYLGGSSTIDEVIGGDASVTATGGEPYVENTLCANAEQYGGELLFTSYASKLDKFTFTGDAQIAHTAAAGAIALATCKGDLENYEIAFETAQGTSACWFEYEGTTSTNGNYCDNDWPVLEMPRFLIEATSGAFGDIDDKYSITAEITSPSDGVYFGGYPVVKLFKSSDEECADAGTTVTTGFDAYEGTTKLATWAPNAGNCTLKDGEMVDTLIQTDSTVFETDGYDTIWVDFSRFVYGNTLVAAGEEVTVQVTLNRYPCGQIFQGSRTIGNFVTTCSTTIGGTTTLYFPWLPGSAVPGWWGGFVITNFSTTAGTVSLAYNDANGHTGRMTSDEVAAGAQLTIMAPIDASTLTMDSGETFDSTLNFSVTAVCNFGPARGFAFTGNGEEGVGYGVHP